MRLSRDFFEKPTLDVAKNLLGKKLIFKDYVGLITETEAYIGTDDPACHASKGLTTRTSIMFGAAGFSYVYLIYGMYYCFNIVTEKEGYPAAVLIRGLKMAHCYLDGPGKLCKHLGITKEHNAIDLITSSDFFVEDTQEKLIYKATQRIGISKGQDKLWRFVVTDKVL